MKNDIIEKAKQWIGDLLYENGVHQREKHIFDTAENELEKFFIEYGQTMRQEGRNDAVDFIQENDDVSMLSKNKFETYRELLEKARNC